MNLTHKTDHGMAQADHQFAYTGVEKDKFKAMLLAIPALLLLFVFLILPFFVAVSTSLTDKRLLSPNEANFVGMDNYARLLSIKYIAVTPVTLATHSSQIKYQGALYPKLRDLLRSQAELKDYSILYQFSDEQRRHLILAKDPLFIKSLINTVKFVIMVVPIQISLALLFALLFNGKSLIRRLFKLIFFSPVVTSMVVVCVVWSMIYQQHGGLLNMALANIFPSYQPIDWLRDPDWAMFSIVILSAWQGMGIQMLIILAGLQSIPKHLYEAAALDGANRWAQFKHVTLPGLKNTLIVVSISTTIFAFALFVQVDVLTQGGPQDATSTVLFYAIEKGFRQQQIAYGATICILYFVLIVMIGLLQKRLISHAKD